MDVNSWLVSTKIIWAQSLNWTGVKLYILASTIFFLIMNRQINIVGLFAISGILVAIVNSLLEYYFFYQGNTTLLEFLLIDVPNYEVYTRFVILFVFLSLGFIISKLFSQRDQAIETYKGSVDYVESILKSMSDALILINPDATIRSVNNHTLDLLGYIEEELIGESVAKIIDVEGEEQQILFMEMFMMEGLIEKDFMSDYEMELKTKAGLLLPASFSGSILRDIKGSRTGVMVIARDITERKEAEKAIKKYAQDLEEANIIKDLFSDIMHHDILNPAGTIRVSAELLLDNVNGQDKELVEMIIGSVNRQIDMVGNANKLSKLDSWERLEKEDIDLKDVIAEAIEGTKYRFKNAGLKVEVMSDSHPIKANPIIMDIFLNLLSNAAKYAPDGEKVIIEVIDEGINYRVLIKDFGPGIPDEYKEGIFERFTRKEKEGVKGMGLGMAISKRIVDVHNGKIWVEDNPKGGSIFNLRLPKE